MIREEPPPYYPPFPTRHDGFQPTSLEIVRALAESGASFDLDYDRLSIRTFKDDVAKLKPDPETLNILLELHLIQVVTSLVPIIEEMMASTEPKDMEKVTEWNDIVREMGACNTCFVTASYENQMGKEKYAVRATISLKEKGTDRPVVIPLSHEGQDAVFETNERDLDKGRQDMKDGAFRRLNCSIYSLIIRAHVLARKCGFLDADADVVHVNAPEYDKEGVKEVLRKHGRGDK